MVHTHLVDQLCRFPNVYADTSGVRYWECLVQAVKRAGLHKILFGSDGPLLHPAVELSKIKMLRLPPSQQALITGGNTARLLGWGNDYLRSVSLDSSDLVAPITF